MIRGPIRAFLALVLVALGLAAWGAAARARASVADRPPDIVLVSFDTLRADRLGVYGNPRGLTPNLDALASSAAVFQNAYCQASATLPSHASLFTGRYASEISRLNAAWTLPVDGPETLAQILSLYGYQTGAAVAGGHLHPQFGLSRGFSSYQVGPDFGSFFHTVPLALSWLDGTDPGRPSFLFLHGYDAHARYLKPSPFGYLLAERRYRGVGREMARREGGTLSYADGLSMGSMHLRLQVLNNELRPRGPEARALLSRLARAHVPPPQVTTLGDLEHVRAVYDGAAQYADAWFGVFLRRLADRGRLDRAWLVVVADHGEQLGEDGIIDHQDALMDEEARVPLLIRPPGGLGRTRRVSDVVELMDLFRTLLQAASARPPAASRGASLIPAVLAGAAVGDGAAFTQGIHRISSLRTSGARIVLDGMPSDSPLAALVAATLVPGGPGMLVWPPDAPAAEVARARAALVSRFARLRPAAPGQGSASPADPSLTAALRAHGYWSAPR